MPRVARRPVGLLRLEAGQDDRQGQRLTGAPLEAQGQHQTEPRMHRASKNEAEAEHGTKADDRLQRDHHRDAEAEGLDAGPQPGLGLRGALQRHRDEDEGQAGAKP